MSESQLRQLNGKGDEILQKQWERVVAALRAADTADKVDAIWDLVERTSRETSRAKVFGHDLQGLIKVHPKSGVPTLSARTHFRARGGAHLVHF